MKLLFEKYGNLLHRPKLRRKLQLFGLSVDKLEFFVKYACNLIKKLLCFLLFIKLELSIINFFNSVQHLQFFLTKSFKIYVVTILIFPLNYWHSSSYKMVRTPLLVCSILILFSYLLKKNIGGISYTINLQVDRINLLFHSPILV